MAETITKPGTPTGTASVKVGGSTTLTTTGATSSLGHALEYRWTWGDGTTSTWLSAAEGLVEAHTYSTSAIRSATVQARCAAHPTILSAASDALAVAVYNDEVAAVAKVAETVGLARTTEAVAA